jgi:hypothetical protein
MALDADGQDSHDRFGIILDVIEDAQAASA